MAEGKAVMRLWFGALVLAAALQTADADAFDSVVEKQVFTLPSYTTAGGETIPQVRIGYETYGTLNEQADNAILITHYFSGTSHAAGKYGPEDKAPGYWDMLIGKGLAIDTDKYFVISSDNLVNLNANDPKVTTTGPASVNPATGRPWGMSFPLVTIRDFVNVQKELIASLGIKRLHAVIGASMGALQALEWASAYPDMVDRVVPVIGAGEANPFLVAWLNVWAQPIMLDPKWNGGDYYDREPPLAGLAAALKVVTLQARYYDWAEKEYGRAFAEEGKDPAKAFANRYKIEAALDAAATARAKLADANHFLYLVKANQSFMAGYGGSAAEGLRAINAPTLLIASRDDLVFLPPWIESTEKLIEADGTAAEIAWIDGGNGHLDGITAPVLQAADRLKTFLAQ